MIKYVEILVHHMVWYSYLEEGELKKQLYAINVFFHLPEVGDNFSTQITFFVS